LGDEVTGADLLAGGGSLVAGRIGAGHKANVRISWCTIREAHLSSST
jgi:hypothetical protein